MRHFRRVAILRLMDPKECACRLSSEPLLAFVDEGDEEQCISCAVGAGGAEAPPRKLQFERYRKGSSGLYAIAEVHDFELPQAVTSACEAGEGPCLPWVKISRDPKRFRACLARARTLGPIKGPGAFYDLVKEYMIQEDQEVFYVLLLDTQLQVRGISELARGARDRVLTPIPDVLRLPLVDGALAFAVAHNHPSGKLDPSKADKDLTTAIQHAADAVGLHFSDHIVVGADGFFSFREQGLLH